MRNRLKLRNRCYSSAKIKARKDLLLISCKGGFVDQLSNVKIGLNLLMRERSIMLSLLQLLLLNLLLIEKYFIRESRYSVRSSDLHRWHVRWRNISFL